MKSPLANTCLLTALSAIFAHAENLVKNGGFESGENEFGPRWPTPNKQKS